MKITAQEEYGMRCIIQLARAEGLRMTAVSMAKAEGISVPYVVKLLNILKKAGLVTSERGVKGGYTLARVPNEISLSQIISPLGGDLYHEEFCECFPGQRDSCVHFKGACSLRSLWSVLGSQIHSVLSQTTLAEILERNDTSVEKMLNGRFTVETPYTAVKFPEPAKTTKR